MEQPETGCGMGLPRRRRANRERIAALDLGTNNCRLLVAEPTDAGFEVVDSFSRIVRLGEGLATGNRLCEAAMIRTLRALRVCKRIIERNDVVKLRCVATEACRRADNGVDFIARVERVTGIKLEILDQEEEARLAMLGCLPLIDTDADDLMMVDIGGGSTEILMINRAFNGLGSKPTRTISLPVGVVTLAEEFDSPIDTGLYADMVEAVRGHLRAQNVDVDSGTQTVPERVQMLGTSGTVTTLAALHLGLRRYDRRKVDGVSLSFHSIDCVSRYVRSLGAAELAAHPCIGRGRADLVVAGCAILDAVHEVWPVPGLRVADRGVREGILNALLGRSLRHIMRPNRPLEPTHRVEPALPI